MKKNKIIFKLVTGDFVNGISSAVFSSFGSRITPNNGRFLFHGPCSETFDATIVKPRLHYKENSNEGKYVRMFGNIFNLCSHYFQRILSKGIPFRSVICICIERSFITVLLSTVNEPVYRPVEFDVLTMPNMSSSHVCLLREFVV